MMAAFPLNPAFRARLRRAAVFDVDVVLQSPDYDVLYGYDDNVVRGVAVLRAGRMLFYYAETGDAGRSLMERLAERHTCHGQFRLVA